MKRIILIVCILFMISSCEIQYDGETKIVVTGKILDENNAPLSEKDINITIYSDGLYTPSDLISFGKSDQNGNFTLIFPAPKVDYKFSILINNLINQTNEFQPKDISAKRNNFENYKLDLGKIILYQKKSIATLQLILNKTSSNKQIKDIKIEGKQANYYIDLNPIQDNSNNFETYYNVIKNQTIVLKYTIIDYSNNNSTVQSISIPIVNEAVTYTITY